ncbi:MULTISPECIES: acyl carrier protein [Micromonospora]|uniref:Acyl carrier protein n=1 Tax=Micromonospora yangpuensis TaxID=683228 RepID=A0A1C6UFI9_9ACTN|nr:phosphopantetheine-binding protein [Micromonospora yangpuensis]GGM05880.1 acyl carrier protein [Micromonospora yangpuensis]SCL52653.1 acyl carrier protein [Micromonospora yangpuensis]
MNRAELVTAISGCLQDVLQRPLPDLDEQTRLFEDLHLDSTTILELLMAVEEAVDVEFDMEALKMDDFRTLGTLTDSVEQVSEVPV